MTGWSVVQDQIPAGQQLPSPDEVSQVLHEILAGPEFATFAPSLWQQFWSWVQRVVSAVWDWLRFFVDQDNSIWEVVVLVVVLLAVVLIAVKVAATQAPRFRTPWLAEDDLSVAKAPVTAREWFGMASTQASHGRFRPAATALYQGFLLTLEQRDMLSFHGAKTPGDYAAEIARHRDQADQPNASRLAQAGNNFLSAFEDFSFGHLEPTASGYAQLAKMVKEAGCASEKSEATSR